MIAGSIALVLPHLAGNDLRPLMQLGLKRQAALTDVPTANESGFPSFEADTLLLEGPEGLRTFFARQVDIWGKVVRDDGITVSN
jgi:tripartite-type tricarboxylate transporter receptor subunit TctC